MILEAFFITVVLGLLIFAIGMVAIERGSQFTKELFRRMDYLYSELYQLRRKVERLETSAIIPSETASLAAPAEAKETPLPQPEPATEKAPEPVVAPVETVVTQSVVAEAEVRTEAAPVAAPLLREPEPVPTEPSLESRAQVLFQRGWNWFWIGKEKLEEGDDLESIAAASWLTRLGMIILVLGLGFFIKFSIDRGLFPPTLRILGTTVVGLAMYFAGLYYWKGRMNLLGQALSAGGAAVLYFSCYAASQLYELISLDTACGGACMITALLVFSAWKRQSQLLASLGMLGAYGTPLMFELTPKTPYPILAYLSILAIGLAVIRRKQNWMIPVWIALWGTIVYHRGTIFHFQDPTWVVPMLAFTGVLFAAFHLIAQRHFCRRIQAETFWELCLVIVNTLYFSLMVLSLIHHVHSLTIQLPWGTVPFQDWLHGITFGVSAFVFFVLALLLDRKLDNNRVFRSVNWGLGFLSLGMMFFLVCASRWWVPLWMMEAVAMLWVVQKAKSRSLAALAQCATLFLLIFLCVGSMISQYDLRVEQFFSTRNVPETTLVWSQRFLRFLLPLACGYGVTWLTWRGRLEKNWQDTRTLTILLGSLTTIGLLEFLTAETSLWFAYHCAPMRLGAISVLWTLFALGLVCLGMRYQTRALRVIGLLFLAVIVGKIFLVDMSELEQVFRVVAMVLLGILILLGGVLYLMRKKEEVTPKNP